MIFPNGNSIVVTGRHNRPTTLGKTFLEVYFTNDGTYADPYQISSVHVFAVSSGRTSDIFLDLTAGSTAYGLVSPTAELSSGKFVFRPSGTSEITDDSFLVSSYDGDPTTASGIYRISTGRYGVVLQADGSSVVGGSTVGNGASAVADYYDIWTVKMTAASDWQTVINRFHLFSDSFITITEPFKLNAKVGLITKKFNNGEIKDLVLPVDLTVLNRSVDDDILSLFHHSVIDNAQLYIQKKQEKAPWLDVSGYSDTSGSILVDSNDTIRFLFDTTALTSLVGGAVGLYSVQAKFTILNETYISDKLTFRVDP